MSRAHNELPKNLLSRLATYRSVLTTNFDPAHRLVSLQKDVTPASLVAEIDGFFAVCSAVQAAQRALMTTLNARTAGTPGANVLANRCKAVIRAALGGSHPAVDQPFLRGPGGKHEIAVETHVKAAAKRRETRKERKTMGKRQRAKVKAQ
jgi:hypothetical protein